MAQGLLHLVWNLFLAAAAVALAFALVRTGRAHRERGDRVLLVPLALVGAAWLLLLPNTCYLFTEVRHLFDAIEERDLWSHASVSASARAALLVRAMVLAVYASVGALTFGLSIRPVRAFADECGLRTSLALPAFFSLVALGVYLGLVQRLNSWDVLTRPDRVLANTLDALLAPRRVAGVVVGGGVLWAVYVVVDVWLDGLALRLSRSPMGKRFASAW